MKQVNRASNLILFLYIFSASLILIGIFTSCTTCYQTNGYNSEKTYTFVKKGIRYKITDTYTRVVVKDTIKK